MSPAKRRPQPPPDDTYIGNDLTIFSAIWMVVLIVFVALRVYSRSVLRQVSVFELEDILVYITLVLLIGLAGINFGSVIHAGVGYHIEYWEAKDPEKLATWAKYITAVAYTYSAAVNLPKIAISLLYLRLFPITSTRIAVYVCQAIMIGSTLANLISLCVACIPFAANWNPNIENAHCINKEALYIWASFPNIITDLIMLAIPIPVVWRLQATKQMKIGLTVTFAIGSMGLIFSIIRFATFFLNNSFTDTTWSAVINSSWTFIETGIYLISACLITFRPLLEKFSTKVRGMTTKSGSTGRNVPLTSVGRARNATTSTQGKAAWQSESFVGWNRLDDTDITLHRH